MNPYLKNLHLVEFIDFGKKKKKSDALIRACKNGNKNACSWILTMVIDPCVQDESGMTALMYATKNSSLISIVKRTYKQKRMLEYCG